MYCIGQLQQSNDQLHLEQERARDLEGMLMHSKYESSAVRIAYKCV